jgi:hypothetical protein
MTQATLPTRWTEIAQTCNVRAYNDIVTILSQRGYTLAQVLAWDRGAEFERDLADFFVLSQAVADGSAAVERRPAHICLWRRKT